MNDKEAMDAILDGPFTFSINCRSGFVPMLIPQCECWRCRDKRGEPHDEVLAASVAAEADRKWNQVKGEVLEGWRKNLSSFNEKHRL